MSSEAPVASDGRDRRGTPPGQGTIVPTHGGRIGNPPFVATPEQRAQVRQLAKAFPKGGERYIARLIGIDRQTLRKHFADELELGRAEMLAAVASQFINRALDEGKVDDKGQTIAKGNLDAQKFILARLGGWSTKVEHSGPDGGAIPTTFDLGKLAPEQLEAMLPVIDQLLGAAGAEPGEFTEVEADAASDPD